MSALFTPFRVGVYFFSSRRRHTRLGSDWSSDVCSSDLSTAGAATIVPVADSPADLAALFGGEARVFGDRRDAARFLPERAIQDAGALSALAIPRAGERRGGGEGETAGGAGSCNIV